MPITPCILQGRSLLIALAALSIRGESASEKCRSEVEPQPPEGLFCNWARSFLKAREKSSWRMNQRRPYTCRKHTHIASYSIRLVCLRYSGGEQKIIIYQQALPTLRPVSTRSFVMSQRDALNSKESCKVWVRELEGLGNPISRRSARNFEPRPRADCLHDCLGT